MVSNAAVLVAAVGMTLVILCRQIDISIGSIFSICGVVAGLLSRAGLPSPWSAWERSLAGSSLGAVNGVLVARLGLPSIVVTLATLVIWRESLRYVARGRVRPQPAAGFQWFGAGQAAGQWLVVAIALGVFAAFAWGLRYLAAGRAVYATGSDPEAARLAGIRPRGVVFGVFVASGRWPGWPHCSTPSASPTSTPTPAWGWSSRSSRPWSSGASRSPAAAERWRAA